VGVPHPTRPQANPFVAVPTPMDIFTIQVGIYMASPLPECTVGAINVTCAKSITRYINRHNMLNFLIFSFFFYLLPTVSKNIDFKMKIGSFYFL
jgi:hypothetical protein